MHHIVTAMYYFAIIAYTQQIIATKVIFVKDHIKLAAIIDPYFAYSRYCQF
jgi:hypothetical protein